MILREIKIMYFLTKFNCPFSIKLLDLYFNSEFSESGELKEVYMVLELMTMDLQAVIEIDEVKLEEEQIVTLAYNLICGLKYL